MAYEQKSYKQKKKMALEDKRVCLEKNSGSFAGMSRPWLVLLGHDDRDILKVICNLLVTDIYSVVFDQLLCSKQHAGCWS